MNPGTALRRTLKDLEIPHQKFADLAAHLEGRIADASAGYDPCIELIIGPSRVGKTALIRHLQRLHPPMRVGTQRKIPVLFATIRSGVSWTLLPHILVEALGVPPPRASSKPGVMSAWLADRLKAAGTHTVVFEEASHLVDVGSRVPPRAAGDWFKELSESNSISIFMFGVPRLRRLFESNEQLAERAFSPLEFRPYDSRLHAERRAFVGCVRSYLEHFATAGFPFAGSEGELVGQFYLLSGGLIGILSKFMKQLATVLEFEAPRAVNLADCIAAAAIIKSSGHPDYQPFKGNPATKIAMAAAHAYVLDKNGMSVPALEIEGAAA